MRRTLILFIFTTIFASYVASANSLLIPKSSLGPPGTEGNPYRPNPSQVWPPPGGRLSAEEAQKIFEQARFTGGSAPGKEPLIKELERLAREANPKTDLRPITNSADQIPKMVREAAELSGQAYNKKISDIVPRIGQVSQEVLDNILSKSSPAERQILEEAIKLYNSPPSPTAHLTPEQRARVVRERYSPANPSRGMGMAKGLLWMYGMAFLEADHMKRATEGSRVITANRERAIEQAKKEGYLRHTITVPVTLGDGTSLGRNKIVPRYDETELKKFLEDRGIPYNQHYRDSDYQRFYTIRYGYNTPDDTFRLQTEIP